MHGERGKSMKPITNYDDVIDSRDVIARIEELESERWLSFTMEDLGGQELENWKEDYQDELDSLKALAEEAEGSPDWEYGETLIRDSYFTEYAEELCKDIGEIPKELPWYIANHIDWDGVASEIKQDYMSVDFDGVEYWIRA